MIKPPVAIGLRVCQQTITEEKTRHVTLVNCMRRLEVERFPSAATQFVVCAVLADGLGDMELSLKILPLSTMESIFSHRWRISMGDALLERWCYLKLNRVIFPEQGRYQIVLLANGGFVAQMTLDVFSKG